jgi:hypothetical protein
MGDRPPSALKSQGTFRSPFLSVRIQEEPPDDGDTVIDLRDANGGDHYASSSRTGVPVSCEKSPCSSHMKQGRQKNELHSTAFLQDLSSCMLSSSVGLRLTAVGSTFATSAPH